MGKQCPLLHFLLFLSPRQSSGPTEVLKKEVRGITGILRASPASDTDSIVIQLLLLQLMLAVRKITKYVRFQKISLFLSPTNKTALVWNKHHSNFYTHISLDNEIMLLARDNHRSNACSSCRGAVVWNITQRIVSHHLPTFTHFSTLQHWQLETVCKK